MSKETGQSVQNQLRPYLSPAAVWALSLGTSIGWGSLVITSSTYLSQAGPAGSVLGLVIGAVIMLVISRNYHYMMNVCPEAGGAYSFGRDAFGHDHGFLVAWFLMLTYLAILWANATAVPLFARYFIGDIFQFGRMYSLFGYDVFFGEALISILAILLVTLLCMNCRKAVAVLLTGLVSMIIPFLGRTSVGWIVDVTTIGAVLVYGYVSASAWKTAGFRGDKTERSTGLLGMILMIGFGAYLLIPNLFTTGSMATESYFLFVIWAVLGFAFFRLVLNRDDSDRFGKSIIVWVALLALVLFVSLVWMNQSTMHATENALLRIQDYYSAYSANDGGIVAAELSYIRRTNAVSIIIVVALFGLSLGVLLNNYSVMSRRARESESELGMVRNLANTDPLTGVKSKHAFAESERERDVKIAGGESEAFSVVVCDVNGLKHINDTKGHAAGDEYIREACRLICRLYQHSPVFRIGGDEFVVILTGSDFENREAILSDMNRQMEDHIGTDKTVVSAGMSDYIPGKDMRVKDVFERADAQMYRRKTELKSMGARTR